MPSIKIEFSVPEDPDRGMVTVRIEGPDPSAVARVAMETVQHYTEPQPKFGDRP